MAVVESFDGMIRQEWAELGITQLILSTPDLIAAPTQEKLSDGVQFLLEHVARRQQVYVHCKAGRTRSATLVACYLMQRHGWSPEESVEFIRAKRPHIKIRPKQWIALKTYHHCHQQNFTEDPALGDTDTFE